MKKMLNRLSLMTLSMILMGGCSFTSDALFPSLFGSDSQEKMVADGDFQVSGAPLPDLGSTQFEPVKVSEGSNTGTFVGQKVVGFRNELNQLQKSIHAYNEELQKVRSSVINNAMQYHKTIGTIEAKLQVGTTPGNPQMYAYLQDAQNNIQIMNANTLALERLSAKVTSDSAMSSYLLESIRAAYSVSGAVDEDHRQLRILENETNQTSILINSLLNEINSDANRQHQYIDGAKNNIVNLNDDIKVGNYGVSNVPLTMNNVQTTNSYSSARSQATSGKPLLVVKFNKNNVDYQKGLSQAVRQAQAAKNNVYFNIVSVYPASGSQLSKQNAQGHAGKIFKEMIDMGIGADRIGLASKSSSQANSPEVHIFVR